MVGLAQASARYTRPSRRSPAPRGRKQPGQVLGSLFYEVPQRFLPFDSGVERPPIHIDHSWLLPSQAMRPRCFCRSACLAPTTSARADRGAALARRPRRQRGERLSPQRPRSSGSRRSLPRCCRRGRRSEQHRCWASWRASPGAWRCKSRGGHSGSSAAARCFRFSSSGFCIF